MATVPRTPDAALLVRLRERDHAAWEELYVEYQPRLRAFAYRLTGNVHDADDLVQETFVRAVPRLDDLDPATADVGAYLFATTRNLFLKQVERGRRQEPVAEVPEPVAPQPIETDPERSTLLRRQQDEVRIANGRLQPRQRLVLALRELEDRSYAEIGELVGMKENAVAQLIFRARESLRTELRLVQVDPERLPEECMRYLPLLAAHLDGQLKGSKLHETLAHLEGCERCQAALADMREASRRYRTIIFPPFDEDEAQAAVEERLELVGYWTTPAGGRRGRSAWKVGAAVAAALAVGVSGTALGVAMARGDSPAAAPTTQPPVGSTAAVTATSTGTQTQPTTVAPDTTEPTATETATEPTTDPEPTTSPAAPPGPGPTVTTTSPPEPSPTTETQPPSPPKPNTPVDKTPPVVKITSGPAAATSSDTASIVFSANENGVSFTCSVDGGASAPCTSPVVLSALAPGEHRFSVRGKDKAGNLGNPVSLAWTYTPPDTRPPVVTITSAPPSGTTATTASFSFSSDEPGSSFACAVDGGAFAGCTSPVTYQSLSVGSHTFSVRATDQAGNVGQAASHSWTIAPLLPDLVVAAFARNSITITNRGTATARPSILTITLVGTFSVPSIQPGASFTFTWSTCRVGTYTAIVDRTNVVAESNETNNTATRLNSCS